MIGELNQTSRQGRAPGPWRKSSELVDGCSGVADVLHDAVRG